MMKRMAVKVPILFLVLMIGWWNGIPDSTGIIYSISEDSILVISGIEREDISSEEWFENNKPATDYRITEDTKIVLRSGKEGLLTRLKVGQKVKVWNSGYVQESYPSQSTAKKIRVIR
ncbi:DUF3221 domain-containing protein [Bacillus sp. AK128]